MNKTSLIRSIFLSGVGVVVLFGIALIVHTTAKGLSGGSDAVGYLASARNFDRGLGVGYYYPDGRFHLLDIHPPLYIISVGVVALFKIDVIRAALILDIIYFAIVMFFAGYIFHRFSSISSFSLLAVLMLAVFPAFLGIFFSAMTESLYFLLFLGAIYCLLVYLKNHRTLWWILSATLIGLAIVTRYDGISLLPVGLISIFLFDPGTLRARSKKAFFFGILAILPLLIFGISIHFNPGQPMLGRDVQFSWSAILDKFQKFRIVTIALIWNWIPFHAFLPFVKTRSQTLFLLFLAACVVGITFFATGRNRRAVLPKEDDDFRIFLVFALCFSVTLVFLIFTSIVFDLPARMDDRQLLPVYISAVLSLIGGFACWQKAWFRNHGWLQVLAWIVAGVVFYVQIPATIAGINSSSSGGGPLANAWQQSDLVKAVSSLPRDTPVISNLPDVLLLWADRPAYDFYAGLQPGFIKDDKALYGSDPSDSAQVVFREKGAALAIFGNDVSQELENVFWWPGHLRAKTIFDGLVIGERVPDGTIYFYPK